MINQDKKPNVFLVGPPRCGTTSLSNKLRQQQNVMVAPKEIREPWFFADDIFDHELESSEQYIKKYFQKADDYKIVIDNSTIYLYSKVAVSNILEFNPNAKFLVMLRNPVEASHSLHSKLLTSKHENVKSFKRAWHLQEKRKKGKHIPNKCDRPKLLQYGDVYSYPDQIKRLFSCAGKEKVFITFLHEIAENPKEVYSELEEFLGISIQIKGMHPKTNQSQKQKSYLLRKFLALYSHCVNTINKLEGVNIKIELMNRLREVNTAEGRASKMSSEFEEQLYDYYRSDVEKLEDMLNKNLSQWKQP